MYNIIAKKACVLINTYEFLHLLHQDGVFFRTNVSLSIFPVFKISVQFVYTKTCAIFVRYKTMTI